MLFGCRLFCQMIVDSLKQKVYWDLPICAWVKRFIVHGSGLNSDNYLISLVLCFDGGGKAVSPTGWKKINWWCHVPPSAISTYFNPWTRNHEPGTVSYPERWPSGWRPCSRKAVSCQKRDRGFESHPLRQENQFHWFSRVADGYWPVAYWGN